nr:Chain C, SelK C-end Degron [Homo sapiens]6DO3_D Chain D, SelK C-end Degron [Homo sapiens]
PPPMAGG